MEPDLNCIKNPNVQWTGLDFDTPLTSVVCTCKQSEVVAARKILPTSENMREIVCYNSCARTVWAAFKRQCRLTVITDPKALEEFRQYLEIRWYPIFQDIANHLVYDWASFYNHLPRKKQKLLDDIDWSDTNALMKYEFHIFCKREKQIIDSWLKLPKNRAISAPNEEAKAVLGPVVWALEGIIAKFVHGYCDPDKNWGDYEELYKQWYSEGFVYVAQGDGSAYDSTQCQGKKSVVEHVLYNLIADSGKIEHVDTEIFRSVATRAKRKLIADVRTKDGKTIKLATATIDGTVFSGSSDTTFGNTLRMALYQHFIMKQTGYSEDEYRILSKGDDFAVFLKYIKPNLEDTYYKYFEKPSNVATTLNQHGLGMILKYLTIGDYETIDFCSTNVIQDGENFKIVRQANRMNPLCHYTVKGKDFTPSEMHYYLLAQADSIDAWGKGLPYFGDYADAYRYHASKIKPAYKPDWSGKSRVILDTDIKCRNINMKYIDLGYDMHYGYNLRRSDTSISHDAVYRFLLEKYNLTKTEIAQNRENLMKGSLFSEFCVA